MMAAGSSSSRGATISPTALSVCAFLLFGCAPSVNLIRLDLPAESNNAVAIRVLDSRPAEQKQSETTWPGSGLIVNRLGDERFSPDPMTILQGLFQKRLADRLNGKTVVITSFKVSVSNAPEGRQHRFMIIDNPVTVLGSLLGNALVDFGKDPKGSRLVFCEIMGSVDGQAFKADEMQRAFRDTVEDSVKDELEFGAAGTEDSIKALIDAGKGRL